MSQTIQLPEHRQIRLAEILESIPPTQKRISVKKWHQVLGERSMSLALPGSRNLFSQLQHALVQHKGKRIALCKGTHNAIADFKWLLVNISSRPTHIAEIVPLKASTLGHHDASGTGAGGAWFPHSTLTPRVPYQPLPIIWRYEIQAPNRFQPHRHNYQFGS